MNVSSNRTTHQIDQVPDTEGFADFPQVRTGRRKETAQQLFSAEPHSGTDKPSSLEAIGRVAVAQNS